MLLLTTVNDFVQIGIASASIPIDVHTSWVDTAGTGTITPGRKNQTTNVAGLLIIVPAPVGGTSRNAKTINIRNKHASLPNQITFYHFDGTTNSLLYDIILAAGRTLEYSDQGGFRLK